MAVFSTELYTYLFATVLNEKYRNFNTPKSRKLKNVGKPLNIKI